MRPDEQFREQSCHDYMKFTKSSSFIVAAGFVVFGAVLFGRETEQAEGRSAAQRGDPPDYVRCDDSDKEMAKAVQHAHRTLGQFTNALRSPKASQSHFEIKKAFIRGDMCEHVWISDVTFDGRVFHGKIDNDPVDIKTLRRGKEVTVQPKEVSDWMYVDHGRLVGGYTVRTLFHRLSADQKQQFAQKVHFRVD